MKKFLHFLFALTLVFYFAKSVNAEEIVALNLDGNELFEQVKLTTPDTFPAILMESLALESFPATIPAIASFISSNLEFISAISESL